MDKQTAQNIRNLINQSKNIAIAAVKEPSLDQMAAALSLYLGLETMGKKAEVVCPTPPLVELSNLVGIDKVKSSYESQEGDLIVSFPYKEDEGEIEKVSYNIDSDNGYLHIVVKAGEKGLGFDESDVRFKKGGGKLDLVFAVGTSRESLDALFGETLANATIIQIDNKEVAGFGDMVLVSPRFSSLSEQVADLLFALAVQMDQDLAQNLFNGIVEATNNFQNPTTSDIAFEMVAMLMRRGARRVKQDRVRFVEENLQSSKQVTKIPEVEEKNEQKEPKTPPDDWLTPKVYKGSMNI